jgi:threonine synthase
MWRWHELLPIEDLSFVSSLGEGDTPLLPLNNIGNRFDDHHIYAKEESVNPTASFKARGLSTAVSKANEIGLKNLVIPTAGNAGGALAAYSSRVRMKSAAVMPADTPCLIINECRHYGAEVILVDGLISDCAAIVEEMTSSGEWFSVSTFREPYRLEGKKIMGYELAEEFGWRLPNTIIFPTGGGTGLIGLWKAFQELKALGWLEDPSLPKMVSVQSEGCAPIVKAFNSGSERCEFWEDASTIAAGLRVPLSLADRWMLEILRESGGAAISVKDEEMLEAQIEFGKIEGIFTSPEGAATLVALNKLLSNRFIKRGESVVVFITASGVKYIE